jgi:chaperonin GroES
MANNLRPLRDTVFLEIEKQKETKSGLVLPDDVETGQFVIGKVTAMGPGKVDTTRLGISTVSVGDTVIAKKYGFKEIKIEDRILYVGSEEDILAIF